MEEMHRDSSQDNHRSSVQEEHVEVATQNGKHVHQLAKETLTENEAKVLALYQRLRSSGKVADELGLRDDTVAGVLVSCRDKLGFSTIKELIGVRPGQTSITATSLMAMLIDQDYRCALSGVLLDPTTATLDHKQSVSEGGEHEIGNVWFVHRDVNAAKSSMPLTAFIEMCLRVAKVHGDRPV